MMCLMNNNIPESYRPISAWGYFGYNLLFSIPIIGFILLLVFALGGTANINLRNYARSFFCGLLLILIVSAIAAILFVGIGVISGS